MERIKVAIIDPVGAKAGMDYYDKGLLNGLSKQGVDTYLFSNFQDVPNYINNYKVFDLFVRNKLIQGLRQLIAHLKAFRISKKENVEWLVFHVFSVRLSSFLFCYLAKLFRFKILIIAHDVDSLATDDSQYLKKCLYNYVGTHIIVHNQYSFNKLKKIMSNPHKQSVIQQGGYIDIVNPVIDCRSAKDKLGFRHDITYILFFGQIKKAKRLDVLIKSLTSVKYDFRLVIAGKPWKDDFDKYQKIIDENNLSDKIVKYIRFISDEERELLMKACDITVLPYEEVYQSAVLLMSMSYQMGIIVSDISAFQEVIDQDKNGLIFKSLDPVDLGQKINSLLEDKALLRRLQKGSINSINSTFSWTNIGLQYKKVFNLYLNS